MNILGINGSPHPQGNTAYALGYGLKKFETKGAVTKRIDLGDLNILPCKGCFRCIGAACIHQDEMHLVEEAMVWCDGLILASPVYMGMVTGQMKMMMDRSVSLRVNSFQLSGKVGGGIACGGFRNGGQELTLQNMQTFFLQQDMLAVADGPRFSHSGATIVGKAAEDEIGLQTVDNLVEKIYTTLFK